MTTPDEPSPRFAQEPDRVATRSIATLFVAGIVITIVSVWVSSRLLDARRDALGRPRPAVSTRVAPRQIGRVEQTPINEAQRGADVRAAQARVLGRYGWVDRDAGLARIPIDRAMDLVIARARAATDGGDTP